MNRADKRREERKVKKEEAAQKKIAEREYNKDIKARGFHDPEKVFTSPLYSRLVKRQEQEIKRNWDRNGITEADLKREYDHGHADAMRKCSDMMTKFYFAAAAIALHRDFGFNLDQVTRVTQTMYNIITTELSSGEIVERCRKETGLIISTNVMEENSELDAGPIDELMNIGEEAL